VKKDFVPTRLFCVLSALSGILGVLMLIISFNINPGPPPGASLEQLRLFGAEYFSSILWGAWLQTLGPFFIVLFALALVSLAGASHRLSGLMTLFGASLLMTVSILEVSFFIAVLFKDPPLNSLIGMNTIYAVQHLYFIIAAPGFFIPLGFVILGSTVLPRLFGFLAILLGLAFGVLGILYLMDLVLPLLVTAFAGIQVLWWLSAAVALIIRSNKLSATPTGLQGE
jgi:hypothetical protein